LEFLHLAWSDFDEAVGKLAELIEKDITTLHNPEGRIYIAGQPRGGLFLAVALSHKLDIELFMTPQVVNLADTLIWIDDILDTGKTADIVSDAFKDVDLIFLPYVWVSKHPERKSVPYTLPTFADTWVVFPWENTSKAVASREDFLQRRKL